MDLLTIGKGKVTYTLAAVAVVWGLIGAGLGYISWDEAQKIVWAGLVAFGLRRAV